MGNASSHIPNPIGSHFAADFPYRTTYRRVINGTLGFVHLLGAISQILNKRDALTFDNDALNLGRKFAGLKLSHIHPCNTDHGNISPSTSIPFCLCPEMFFLLHSSHPHCNICCTALTL